MLDIQTSRSSNPDKKLATAVLCGSEIATLMEPAAYLEAVEAGFRALARDAAMAPMPMHIPAGGGAFHAKSALLLLDRAYVAVKVNANFPDNPQRRGLPTIQGAVLLFDAADGSLLAVLDSTEITTKRTAAATVLAARYLARPDSSRVAICGCGEQGRAQLMALAQVFRLEGATAWDLDAMQAQRFATEMRTLGFEVAVANDVRQATRDSDIIVTATSAQTPFLDIDCVSAGTFVAAVGADSPHKNEIAGDLLATSKVVVDVLAQCVAMGDLRHAIEAGLMSTADVHAELSDLVVGRRSGRTTAEEITVFDSTGVAIQDAASAAWIYQRAVAADAGRFVRLAA